MMSWLSDPRDTGEGCTVGEARRQFLIASLVVALITFTVFMAMKPC